MKRCARCGEVKDDDEFNWRWKNRGVRQSVCRECLIADRKTWYDANAEKVKEHAIKTKRQAIDEAMYFVYDYLSHSLCKDCGEYDFAVLTFDHVRGKKRMAISEMASQGYSLDAIKDEMTKCEVLCFNCHMRRENERRSGGRFRRFWPRFPWEK